MLSDEEKEAIDIVKGLAVYYDDYGLLDEEEIEENEEVNNSINIVINLIEKQSKEIEELKEKDDANLAYYDQIYQNGIYTGQKAVEDKIKAKIEEVKDGTFDAKIVLQSLLEKE